MGDSSVKQFVFVYGTLKRGFCRHQVLSDQRFLGLAKTRPLYCLIDLGDYPGLIHRNSGFCVDGELFEVDSDCIDRLDQIEGVSEGLYHRTKVELKSPWEAIDAQTYIYLLPVDGYPEIAIWTKKSAK